MGIERIVKAVKRYLTLRGMDVIGETECKGTPVLVAEDEDEGEIVFAYVFEGAKDRPFDHNSFVQLLCDWGIEHDMGDSVVRADAVSVNVIGTDRAIVQHRVGWSNAD